MASNDILSLFERSKENEELDSLKLSKILGGKQVAGCTCVSGGCQDCTDNGDLHSFEADWRDGWEDYN